LEAPFPAYQGDQPYIFVCYSHEDAAVVYPEIERLHDRGFNIWYDEGITPGEEWTAELAQRVRAADHILFFMTNRSLASKHCRNEVLFAQNHDRRLVLVHLEDVVLPDSLALSLGSMQAIVRRSLPTEAFHEKLEYALQNVGDSLPPARLTTNTGSSRAPVYAVLCVVLVVVVGAVSLWLLGEAGPGSDTPNDAISANVSSATTVPGFSGRAAIAVLPFINISNDAEQEYFADGITEDLITGLQSFRSFPIIARTSTFQYKNAAVDIRQVAADLGAGYVIEGSVRKVGNEVRITVQLNDSGGRHVWAEGYNFEFKDVLRVQAELVNKILLEIEPELIITEADRSRFVRTEDMEAFDYFLQATTNTYAPFAFTDLNGQYVSPERLEKARELAHKALELDPNFAAAYRLLNHIDGSYIINLPHLLDEPKREETLRRAIEAGEKSRLLSPFEPTVCSCLAAMLLISGDIDGAMLLQEESLRLNPANAGVHAVMAKILHVAGAYDRALSEVKLAQRLSPKDMAMTTFLYFEAATYQAMGLFDEAVKSARRSLLLSPVNYDAEYVLITSLYAAGKRQQAQAALEKLRSRTPVNFNPVYSWDEPFPTSVTSVIVDIDLAGVRYDDGLSKVFLELGW